MKACSKLDGRQYLESSYHSSPKTESGKCCLVIGSCWKHIIFLSCPALGWRQMTLFIDGSILICNVLIFLVINVHFNYYSTSIILLSSTVLILPGSWGNV